METYQSLPDQELIEKIVNNYPGLSSGERARYIVELEEELLHYYQPDSIFRSNPNKFLMILQEMKEKSDFFYAEQQRREQKYFDDEYQNAIDDMIENRHQREQNYLEKKTIGLKQYYYNIFNDDRVYDRRMREDQEDD